MMSYKTINLIVVGDLKCTTTVAYLEYMYRSGFVPKAIILCNFFIKKLQQIQAGVNGYWHILLGSAVN